MTTPAPKDDAPASGFLARWSRRKLQSKDAVPQQGGQAAAASASASAATAAPGALDPAAARAAEPVPPPQPQPGEPAPIQPAAPAPTLDELRALDHSADLRRFVAAGVDEGVRRAALRKMFQAPQFNVMDGLNTYTDDYNVASPIPAAMLERLRQRAAAGLFAQPDAPMADAVEAGGPTQPTASAAGDAAEPAASQPGTVALASQAPQHSPPAAAMTPADPTPIHPAQPDAPPET
ncbi:conserved hypothetical protein [Thiomonas sp. X19]|uniref:DUF3306 domain-containing protein n=1 Tax=Thiomonas sp. X19 TaxID=1050370 RepID=UPI000B73E5B2|nr:DUF3306 domain-containing protein [Thiomonas sp. X19]SCC91018.1 conserved hypothetical protein [Thiomonas sp. X19]